MAPLITDAMRASVPAAAAPQSLAGIDVPLTPDQALAWMADEERRAVLTALAAARGALNRWGQFNDEDIDPMLQEIQHCLDLAGALPVYCSTRGAA